MAKYTKAYLKSLDTQEKFGSEEFKSVWLDLFHKAQNEEVLSIAESMFVCAWIEVTKVEGATLEMDMDPSLFKCCKDYIFGKLYLTYNDNLNGTKGVKGPIKGQRTLQLYSLEKRQEDVKTLQTIHEEWFPNIQKFNHKGNPLLNIVASEANKELKVVRKLFKEGHWGRNVLSAKEKAISLQSKYIYNTVRTFFEEEGNDTLLSELFGQDINIDQESMVHIMFRHYAARTKQYDTGKSYHMDKSINPFELPSEIKKILDDVSRSNILVHYQDLLPIELNSTLYSFWIKEKHGKLKVTTFYPVSDEDEFEKIKSGFTRHEISEGLAVFRKRISDK